MLVLQVMSARRERRALLDLQGIREIQGRKVLLAPQDQKATRVTLDLRGRKARPAFKVLQASKESRDPREMLDQQVSKVSKVQLEMLAKPDLQESKGQPAT